MEKRRDFIMTGINKADELILASVLSGQSDVDNFDFGGNLVEPITVDNVFKGQPWSPVPNCG